MRRHGPSRTQASEKAPRRDEREGFLLKLNDALRSLADPMIVKTVASRVLGTHLKVNRAFYAEIKGGDWIVVKGYECDVEPMPDGAHSSDKYGYWIMQTYRDGGRIVFRDTRKDPRLSPAERDAHAQVGIVGAVGVPLVKGGSLLAIFIVHSIKPRKWRDEEIALIEETAERTWSAVERAKAELALRTNEADARLLQSVGAALIRAGHPQAIYDTIVDAAIKLMRAQFASVHMLVTQGANLGELRLLAHRGFTAEAAEFCRRVTPVGNSTCGLALRAGKRFVVSDVERSEALAGCQERDVYLRGGIRAGQSTPLVSRSGKLLGMMSTYWDRTHALEPRELANFDILARQTADIIERRLAEQRTAADLEAVSRLQRAGAFCARMDCSESEALAVLLDAAVFVTAADKGNIQLLDTATGTLRIAVQRGFEERFIEFFRIVTDDDAAACGAAFAAVSRVVVPDVRQSELFAGQPALQVLLDAGVLAVQSTPLVSSTGRVLGMISTHYAEPRTPSEHELRLMDLLARQAADYLERRRAEQALQQSDERHRALVAILTDVAWFADARGELVSPHSSQEAFTGQPTERSGGEGWADPIHPEDREHVKALWRHAVQTGSPYESRGRIWHAPTQSYRHYVGRAVPLLNPDGSVREWVGAMTDVHEQKTAEQVLRDADRRKDEFLATLSHELRNPLAPLLMSVDLLERDGSFAPATQRVLATMRRQVDHLVRLVDDLLDVSRITSDKLALRTQRIELRAVIDAASEACAPLIERLGHEFKVSLPSESVWLDADPVRLAQVFANLINNACKYTPAHGLLSLSAERQGSDVVIHVHDTGVGIPREQLGDVFTMFRQVGRQLDRERGGLGIGLHLVKRLVEMHGGRVDARSEGEGKGAEFVVYLPVCAKGPAPVQATGGLIPSVGVNQKILIVDDNVDAAQSLALLMSEIGHDILTAHDGVQALDLARRHRPNIVLMDIGMPRMNGLDACREIRRALADMPPLMIAVSGWEKEADRRASAEAGFDMHLVKPVSYSDLMKSLAIEPPISRPG